MLKIKYFPDTDTLYFDFSESVSTESEEVYEDVIFDFDENNKITGICFEHASQKIDLDSIKQNMIIDQNIVDRKIS